MEKIDNIQKEEIAGDPTLKEVPSESEYETETDDEVFLWKRYWFNDDMNKVGCIFPMVTLSEFRMGQFRDDDLREDAPHFKHVCL